MALANIKLSEYVNSSFSVLLRTGETLEQALKPEYWAHVAENFHTGDEIIVTADDYSWRATLVVTSAERTSARVAVYQFRELVPGVLPSAAPPAPTPPAGNATHLRRWNAKLLVHEIVRLGDNAVVDSFKDKGEAEASLAERNKSLV